MRILTLTSWYPPHHLGGYELSCYDVMTRLERNGHRVAVLCSDQTLAPVDDIPDAHALGVHRRLKLYFEDGQPTAPPVRERLAIERHNQRILADVYEHVGPDIVFVWQMSALSLGLLSTIVERDIPVVYAVCDDWLVYGSLLDRWAALFSGRAWRRALGRVVRPFVGVPTSAPNLGRTGTFCFVSEITRTRAQAMTGGDFPRSTVVYSGIDESAFPLVVGSGAEPGSWGWRLMFAGRLDPRKGLDTLLEALALLPEHARLEVFGRGTQAEHRYAADLVAQRGLSSRVMVSESSREGLAARYREADVVVFPSEWDEPFGLVPVEAMASGTPVVATGTGGSGEYLQDGFNALLFPPGDAMALADALRRLASDPELRRRLIEGGRETASVLTADALAETFEAWLVAALDGFRHGEPKDRTLPFTAVKAESEKLGDTTPPGP